MSSTPFHGSSGRAGGPSRTVSMRAEVETVSVTAGPALIDSARKAESDLVAAGRVGSIDYTEGEFSVESKLAQDSSNRTSRS